MMDGFDAEKEGKRGKNRVLQGLWNILPLPWSDCRIREI
jgi:hypothetical protein